MLVLGRKKGESLTITTEGGEEILVYFLGFDSGDNSGRIGVEAPRSIKVDRSEKNDSKKY